MRRDADVGKDVSYLPLSRRLEAAKRKRRHGTFSSEGPQRWLWDATDLGQERRTRFQTRLTPGGHMGCDLSSTVAICRSEATIRRRRHFPPQVQKMLSQDRTKRVTRLSGEPLREERDAYVEQHSKEWWSVWNGTCERQWLNGIGGYGGRKMIMAINLHTRRPSKTTWKSVGIAVPIHYFTDLAVVKHPYPRSHFWNRPCYYETRRRIIN